MLIILSFEVFFLFSLFFLGIWQGERTLLPLAWTSHLECTAHASYCLSPIVTSSPRPTPPSSFRRLLPLLHDPPCPVLAAAALGAPMRVAMAAAPGQPEGVDSLATPPSVPAPTPAEGGSGLEPGRTWTPTKYTLGMQVWLTPNFSCWSRLIDIIGSFQYL